MNDPQWLGVIAFLSGVTLPTLGIVVKVVLSRNGKTNGYVSKDDFDVLTQTNTKDHSALHTRITEVKTGVAKIQTDIEWLKKKNGGTV